MPPVYAYGLSAVLEIRGPAAKKERTAAKYRPSDYVGRPKSSQRVCGISPMYGKDSVVGRICRTSEYLSWSGSVNE